MDIGHAIKCVTTGMPELITGGVPGCRAGVERLSYFKIDAPELIHVESEAFEQNRSIPPKYSRDSQNISPPLHWTGEPEGTASLALIVEDPDAPTPEPYVHWMVFNIQPKTHRLPEGYMGFGPETDGKNSTLHLGYVGMAPPKGDHPHHYHFQLYALDCWLDLISGTGRSKLLKAMHGHVIAKGELIGTYVI